MLCELTPETRLEVAALVYSKWAESYDELKVTKNLTWMTSGKFCPKADWPEFHSSMLKTAETKLTKWAAIKDEFCKYSPLITKE